VDAPEAPARLAFRASQAGLVGEVFTWADIPAAHTKMLRNEHLPGNMAVLVQSPRTGLRTLEEVLDAGPTK